MTNTQDENFWRKRIDNHNWIEGAMAIGFYWELIDPVHKDYIERYIKPTDKVLDAGCGYGRTSSWFKDELYLGVDFFPEFVAEARRRHPNKNFVIADLCDLPFEDQEFDWGILISVRVVVRSDPNGEEKWERCDKELRRVCKKLMFLDYGASDPLEIQKSFEII